MAFMEIYGVCTRYEMCLTVAVCSYLVILWEYMWKMNGVVVVRNMCQVECKTFNTNVFSKTDFPTKGGNTLLYTVLYTQIYTADTATVVYYVFFSFSSLFSFLSHNFT